MYSFGYMQIYRITKLQIDRSKDMQIYEEQSSHSWVVRAIMCIDFGTSSQHSSRLPFNQLTFSHRRSAWIKKLIQQKLKEAPKNLSVHPFPDPVCHFWAPWWPFWMFEALKKGMIESRVVQGVQ